nr:MAG TPA: hypothetical protein [Bacteriophage sp.]
MYWAHLEVITLLYISFPQILLYNYPLFLLILIHLCRN